MPNRKLKLDEKQISIMKNQIEYGRSNAPSIEIEKEVAREKVMRALDHLLEEPQTITPEKAKDPHKRLVLLIEPDQSVKEAENMTKDDLIKKEEKGEKTPEVLLVDSSNRTRASISLHDYLDRLDIDSLISLVNDGFMSMSHPGIPEAVYSRIEDGDEKGKVTWAGIIGGENIGELTISNFITADDQEIDAVEYKPNPIAAPPREEKRPEKREEKEEEIGGAWDELNAEDDDRSDYRSELEEEDRKYWEEVDMEIGDDF